MTGKMTGMHSHIADELVAAIDGLAQIVERETALVRGGQVAAAAKLESQKSELAQRFHAGATRLREALPQMAGEAAAPLALLRRRHEEFRALLQTNMTVLATAHAVSESIMRGVSDELARKAAPSTYGASGRANAPGANAAQPLAVSRVL